MIKNKNKLILALSIVFCAFINIHCVEAGFQARHYNSSTATGITRWNGTKYTTYEYEMKDSNGISYKAYCMDPGKSLPTGWNEYQCEAIRSDNPHSGRFMWILDNMTGNNTVNVLAVRMLAVATGTNNFADNNYTAASIVNYWWSRRCAEGASDANNCGHFGTDYKKYLYGTNSSADSIIEQAYQLASSAFNNSSYKGNVNDGGYIKFEKDNGKSSENHIVLKISSDKTIDVNNLKFTCKECEKIDWTWNGNSGEIDLIVAQPNCSYTINSYYGASGYYMCGSTKGGSFQKLLTIIRTETNSFEDGIMDTVAVSQPPFVGKIEADFGGNYYKTYCDNDNQCLEKTTIDIPSYCDDSSGKKITITSPKNVVQCILNSKDDAGNTYKMDDTQIKNDNPYCSVWCKEDYDMELPGAKYSDSGRYFALEDTKVHVTRSCYATGPNKTTKNIDIDRFISDVKTLQQEMIRTEDELQKWKALLATNGILDDSTGCSGFSNETKYTWYKFENVPYVGYDLVDCNANTGVCRYQTSAKTANYGYGEKAGSDSIKRNPTGCLASDPNCSRTCSNTPTVVADERQANYDAAKSKLDSLRQQMKTLIEHFENCYNWKNNLCFEPKVLFRYEELYGVDFGETNLNTTVDANVSYKQDKVIDNNYENLSTGLPPLNSYEYIKCDENNCSTEKADKISTLVEKIYYLKKESLGDATYNNRKEFATNYPHGTIEDVPTGSSGPYQDYYYLGAVFPVMFKTPTGVYNWSIKFQGIGQYNNRTTNGAPRCSASALGRLNQVAQSIGKASIGTDLEYVCVYVVDCPECEYECSCGNNPDCVEKYENGEKFCVINGPEPECPECEIYCKNCIFDGDGATYEWRRIALDKVNPNNREMGSNWDNEKGRATIEAIESANESIYKDEPQYSYKITEIQKKNLMDYNKITGTYIDEDLSFHAVGGNVYGISDFLNNGESKGYFTELKRDDDWSDVWSNVSDHQGPSW